MPSFNYSISSLLHVRKTFREHPEAIFTVPGVWPEQRLDYTAWREWFCECLDKKISASGKEANEKPRGRKDCYEWDLDMRRAQRDLQRPRLAIHWLPKELKQRFADRLSTAEDY